MINTLKSFAADEDGAVTVDWVVLTAAIVGLGIAVATTIGDGALDSAQGLGANLDARSVGL